MKYIRTKDGICKETDNVKYKEEILVIPTGKTSFEVNKTIRKITLEPIIKQADNIEELCDAFIMIRGSKHTIYHRASKKFIKRNHSSLAMEVSLGACKVYGAIWTDKGLIYVAKMNEKGELELL